MWHPCDLAICDAGVWPGNIGEGRAGRRLLRRIGPQTLVLWDRGFQRVALLAATLGRQADFLARLPATVKPTHVRTLGDGTTLVALRPDQTQRRRCGEHVVARLIRSTLDDPRRPGHQVEHRCVTALLDPATAPARELIPTYHQRWDMELVVDELKTHQRPARPFRSQRPVGVIQEIYGLLMAHDVLRALAVAAVRAARPSSAAPTRVSFVTSRRLVRDHLVRSNEQRSGRQQIGQQVILLSAWLLSPRANRLNPRVLKQKMTNLRVKTAAAYRHWPQPSKPFEDAIVLLI